MVYLPDFSLCRFPFLRQNGAGCCMSNSLYLLCVKAIKFIRLFMEIMLKNLLPEALVIDLPEVDAQHEEIFTRIERLASKALNEVRRGASDTYSFLRYVECWFERHILEEDKPFGVRLKSHLRDRLGRQ